MMALDPLPQCTALVDDLAFWRASQSRQCSRTGMCTPELAGAILCHLHERKALGYGELELTEGRTLLVERKWSPDGMYRLVVDARIVTNVSHFARYAREHPRQ